MPPIKAVALPGDAAGARGATTGGSVVEVEVLDVVVVVATGKTLEDTTERGAVVVGPEGLVTEVATDVDVTPPAVFNDVETGIVEVAAGAIVVVVALARVVVVVVVRGTKVFLGDDTPVGRPTLATNETRLLTNASTSYVNATCCS
jgi:hypothetical protein